MRNIGNSFWNRPIPRILGILVVVLSFGTIFWLSRNVVVFDSKAALGNTPKNVQISNISPSSATISFVTDGAVLASIAYGKTPSLGEVALDSRDSQEPGEHTIHYFNLSNLDPGTKYFFSITSGDGTFKKDDAPYELTTASNSTGVQDIQFEIKGKVSTGENESPPEGIAYLKLDNKSQLLSFLLEKDGSFKTTLKNILSENLSEALKINQETILKLIISDSRNESNISFFAGSANPLPPVVLSNDYDFTQINLSAQSASESAQITGFPELKEDTQRISGPQIITPKTDEQFKDQQPIFQGLALPQGDVEITIESEDPITTTVQADENGAWQFRPVTKLTPGTHKITIKTLDAQGVLQTITRSFTVFAQGSQFTEPSISPSATPTIGSTPTATPTSQAPTPTTSSTPAATSSPTSQPTVEPTSIVVLPTTVVSQPLSPTSIVTMPPVPDSGSSIVVFGLAGVSLLIGIGSLLFFLL